LLLLLFPFALFSLLIREPGGSNMLCTACHIYARLWFAMVGIRYREIHAANPRTPEQNIYIANHCSYIDILIMFRAMKIPFRPLGKNEMTRYPVFGFFYKRLVITVNRKDLLSRSKSIIDLKETLKRHIPVFIFPEGTFNESGEPLKRFYDGAFRLALKTGTAIRPLVFVDSLQRMHYRSIFTIWPGVCRVVFLREIDVHHYSAEDSALLKKDVFMKMRNTLEEYNTSYMKLRCESA